MSGRTKPRTPEQKSAHRTRQRKARRSKCDATGSESERRAAQARSEAERATILRHYSEDVRRGLAKPPQARALEPPVEAVARYLLDCIDCGHLIRLYRPEPRVPICNPCRACEQPQSRLTSEPASKRGVREIP